MTTRSAVKFRSPSEECQTRLLRTLLSQHFKPYVSTAAHPSHPFETHIVLRRAVPARLAYDWAKNLASRISPKMRIKLLPSAPDLQQVHLQSVELMQDVLHLTPVTKGRVKTSWPWREKITSFPARSDEWATREFLFEAFGDEIRYIHERRDRGFVQWNGMIWERKNSISDLYSDMLDDYAGQLFDDDMGLNKELNLIEHREKFEELDPDERTKLKDRKTVLLTIRDRNEQAKERLEKMRSVRHYENVTKLLKDDSRIYGSVSDYDADPYTINTPSGLVDLRTGQLLPHNPEARCENITFATYQPRATCPEFMRILREASSIDSEEEAARWGLESGDCDFPGQPDSLWIDFMQYRLGSLLVGKNIEQQMTMFYGERGSNGKTTILELAVGMVLGSYAVDADPSTFMEVKGRSTDLRPDLVRLENKRFVSTSEPRDGSALDLSTFKRMTGGERIVARDLYEKPREIDARRWKTILGVNELPRIPDIGGAERRRITVVPFDHQFPSVGHPKYDPHLDIKLRREASGIFSWLVAGAQRYIEARGQLRPPQRIQDVTERYFNDQGQHHRNPVARWVALYVRQGVEGKVYAGELREMYNDWAESQHLPQLTQQSFGRFMKKTGIKKGPDSKGYTVYKNISVKGNPEED